MRKIISILLFTLLLSSFSHAGDLVYNWDMDDGLTNWTSNGGGGFYAVTDPCDGTTLIRRGWWDGRGISQITKGKYQADTVYTMTVRARNEDGGADGVYLNFIDVNDAGVWNRIKQTEEFFYYYEGGPDPTPGDPNDPMPWEVFTYTLDTASYPGIVGHDIAVDVNMVDYAFPVANGWVDIDYVSLIPDKPVIAAHPENTYADPNAEFYAEGVSDSPVHYAWFMSDDNVVGSDTSIGTDSNVLTLENVPDEDSGKYVYCVVSEDDSSFTATSDMARIEVPKLIAHLKFDGDLTDSSGNGWAGSCPDPNFVTGGGIDGDAIAFVRDVNDANRVTITGSETAFNFYDLGLTVNLWCKTPDAQTGGWAGIVTKQPDYSEGWWFGNWPGAPSMNMRTLGAATADTSVTDGQWHMITGTYDGATGETAVYVDGEPAGSVVLEGAPLMTNLPVVIGAAVGDGSSSPFGGLVDDVRIYNYPKSPYAVIDLYNELIEPDKTLCLEQDQPEVDYTGPEGEPDCIVNLHDFAFFAEGWLTSGLYPAQ